MNVLADGVNKALKLGLLAAAGVGAKEMILLT